MRNGSPLASQSRPMVFLCFLITGLVDFTGWKQTGQMGLLGKRRVVMAVPDG
jgi:hypothetical protein